MKEATNPASPQPSGKGLAIASLVVGILSLPLVCCVASPLTGLVAVVLGVAHLKRSPARRGMAIGGITTGAIGVVLGVGVIIFGIVKGQQIQQLLNTPGTPPPLPANLAVRPTFQLKDRRTVEAGTAFGATMDGGAPVLLSALHLLGEAGGLDKQIPAEQIPDVVTGVTLFNIDRSQPIGAAGKGLLREGFPIGEGPTESDCRGDIVAFQLPQRSRVGVAPLAKENPSFLARVWIVGKEFSKAGASADLFPGVVWMSTHKNIVVMLQSPLDLSGFSGAPAVNEKGEIVGIVIGGGSGREGKPVALLNPVNDVRKKLESVQRK
jgi:hypothetical protein